VLAVHTTSLGIGVIGLKEPKIEAPVNGLAQ